MSTLPILYSSHSLDKRPVKQGGIFALKHQNRSHSVSQKLEDAKQKAEPSPEFNELVRNSIKGYYFNRTSRQVFGNKLAGAGSTRYSKSSFGQHNQKTGTSYTVTPDTVTSRLKDNDQIDSVGTLFRTLCTSVILCNAILSSTTKDICEIREGIKSCQNKINNQIQNLHISIHSRCENLHSSLSFHRRETSMETKVNYEQVLKLTEDTENSQTIVREIQSKVVLINSECNN